MPDSMTSSDPQVKRTQNADILHGVLALDERLLTAQEIADRLGVSERWVRDHATRRNPRMRAVKLGPLLRFRWQDVQEFVAELATQKPFKRR